MVKIIHDAFHEIADKYDMDVDTIADIIVDYTSIVDTQLEAEHLIFLN